MQHDQCISGATKVYGIIGCPVAHSLSPVMHNAALRTAGIDGVYIPFPVEPEHLCAAISGLRSLQVAGFNVTVPYKTAIMPFLDELAPSAVQAGAVNTVVNHAGRLVGHNTDGAGLISSIRQDLICELTGTRIILVGAGGAARGALAALCREGVAAVTVVNRTQAAAEALILLFAADFPQTELRVATFDAIPDELIATTDLLINATTLGMADEKIDALSLVLLPGHAKVYDMVYAPPLTPLLADARRHGLACANGLGMLVAQGERAFVLWHGVPAAQGVMRSALDGCHHLLQATT